MGATNRWVRFLKPWRWDLPGTAIPGRWSKMFPAGLEIRLTRGQFQSAMAAGVVISIPNPRSAEAMEAHNVDYLGGDLDPGRRDLLGVDPGGRAEGD